MQAATIIHAATRRATSKRIGGECARPACLARRRLPAVRVRDELRAAGVAAAVRDVTPSLTGQPRWREIAAWMSAHAVTNDQVAIVDDGFDMGALSSRFVRTSPLVGLDADAARSIAALFD